MNTQNTMNEPSDPDPPSRTNGTAPRSKAGFFSKVKSLFKTKQDTSLRDAIEEYIDEPDNVGADAESIQERALFSNVLALRDITVEEVMIPRAEIIAVDVDAPKEDLLAILAEKEASRLPVYKGTLDEVIGTIHLKDIIASFAKKEPIDIRKHLTEVPIVAPSMPVLDLLITMRQTRRHMALVVDEFGGIDGLVTIGDIIESIIGDVEDEHDVEEALQLKEESDGSVLVDARLDLEDFEEKYGTVFNDEERDENDTLGGLVFFMAGRVPVRGEVLEHETGMVFEILDAGPRRVNLIRIRNIPALAA